MLRTKLEEIRRVLVSIAFAALFLFLPISSLPLISKLFGGTAVAPLSVIPAFLLVFILIIPTFFKQRLFSRQFLPLLFFFIFALMGSALVFLREVPSFRSTPYMRSILEAVITLLMGITFYYLCAHFLTTKEKFNYVLRWMNIGAIVMIAFSVIQFLHMNNDISTYPDWLWKMTTAISSSGRAYPRRISGLAFEPSWLAHQLNILYLPIWLGFSLKSYSVYKVRLFKKVSIENILLLFGLASLFFSYSRIGWLTFVGLMAYLIFKAAKYYLDKIVTHLEEKRSVSYGPWQKRFLKLSGWIVIILITMGLVVLAAFIMSKVNPQRTASLLDFQAMQEKGVLGWARLIQIAERLVYWITGFRVFQLNPLFGVGLGMIGYYFPLNVSYFGYKLPEVVSMLNTDRFIPNAKNLWSRLLGETGIIGTALFVSWLYLQWKSATELEKQGRDHFFETMGLVGKLFIVSFVVEGFSMDTFGLPYYWVAFGLVVAAWRMYKNAQFIEIEKQTV